MDDDVKTLYELFLEYKVSCIKQQEYSDCTSFKFNFTAIYLKDTACNPIEYRLFVK
jgi:hypothetical protein